MKSSGQDNYYLKQEGDDFFDRNLGGKALGSLRPNRKPIADQIAALDLKPIKVLEYGCNIGDLLAHLAEAGAQTCIGVEVSQKAIDTGKSLYDNRVEFVRGTIADNAVNANSSNAGSFDLVVIDDVFCWVSRETLYQSIANIDDMLADGGYLFIRDFLPKEPVRNRNHHVIDAEIYCHKVPGSHVSLFLASYMYQVVSQRVFDDAERKLSKFSGGRQFEQRWCDTILRKSISGFYL